MLIADALLWGGWFLLGGETCPASAGHSGSSPYQILVPQHPESRARDGRACTASSPCYQLQVMSKDLCVAKVRTLLGPDDGRTCACVEGNLQIMPSGLGVAHARLYFQV